MNCSTVRKIHAIRVCGMSRISPFKQKVIHLCQLGTRAATNPGTGRHSHPGYRLRAGLCRRLSAGLWRDGCVGPPCAEGRQLDGESLTRRRGALDTPTRPVRSVRIRASACRTSGRRIAIAADAPRFTRRSHYPSRTGGTNVGNTGALVAAFSPPRVPPTGLACTRMIRLTDSRFLIPGSVLP